MKTGIVIDISPPIRCLAKFWSRVMGQNAVGQSNCRILYLKKEVSEVYFWLAVYLFIMYRSLLQVDTIILDVSSQACPEYLK